MAHFPQRKALGPCSGEGNRAAIDSLPEKVANVKGILPYVFGTLDVGNYGLSFCSVPNEVLSEIVSGSKAKH